MLPKILITGASGCVGSYLIDVFAPDYELYLLVRNPEKLRFKPEERQNIHIIHGDMDTIIRKTDILAQMDYCIHAATAWGGEGTARINVQRVHELFNSLNPGRLRRIIYFSTASILGRDNQVLPEAGQFGTDYIKSKFQCYTHLSECRAFDKIITVFPTLVFGGDERHPFSNLTLALPKLRQYSWLIGRLKLDIAFHYIHAADIAAMVKYFLEMENPEKNYVLGNEAIPFGDFARQTAEYFGHQIGWQISLGPKALYRLAVLCGAEMSEWDRFLLQYLHFVYHTVNCRELSLYSAYNTLERILADWEKVIYASPKA